MIKVNLYKMKPSMKSDYGLKSFIDLKREFLDMCILRMYENIWTSTLQEVAVSEEEAGHTQSMLEKIYSFFNELAMDNQRISISVGDVIEIESWAPAAEGSTMILNQTERYFCETGGFQPFQTTIIDLFRLKTDFSNSDLSGIAIREQIYYLYDCLKTVTTADLFGLDFMDFLVHGIVDFPKVLPLIQIIRGIQVVAGDILQFNGIQRFLFNGFEWIPQLAGRVKTPRQYRGVPAIFTLNRIPKPWRHPKLHYMKRVMEWESGVFLKVLSPL
jgi:hypothetical protein